MPFEVSHVLPLFAEAAATNNCLKFMQHQVRLLEPNFKKSVHSSNAAADFQNEDGNTSMHEIPIKMNDTTRC